MSQLTDLLKAVEEKHLTKTQLDEFEQAMTHLHSKMQLEMAELEKEEALYFEEQKNAATEKVSDVAIERRWRATQSGLRQIELNRFIKTLAKELKSIASRLYAIY